jgi:hypothetical protein
MFTASKIKRYVNNLPHGKIFTTRELLMFGTRTAVDQAVRRLIKVNFMNRLARGVFIKVFFFEEINVSPAEIAFVKAAAFGKRILKNASEILSRFDIQATATSDPRQITFVTDGCNSSFRIGEIVVRFKAVCMRKFNLGDNGAAGPLRALWEMGRRAFSKDNSIKITWNLRRSDWQVKSKAEMVSLLPAWLTEQISVFGITRRQSKFERMAERQARQLADRQFQIWSIMMEFGCPQKAVEPIEE